MNPFPAIFCAMAAAALLGCPGDDSSTAAGGAGIAGGMGGAGMGGAGMDGAGMGGAGMGGGGGGGGPPAPAGNALGLSCGGVIGSSPSYALVLGVGAPQPFGQGTSASYRVRIGAPHAP